MLAHDDERRLARSVANGERGARDRLIEANLPLVRRIARRFVGLGVPLGDLVQEGTIGLTQAVDRYEWRDDSRFASYASWWVKQAIMRSLTEQSRAIRLPHYLVFQRVALRRAEAVLLARLGRQPTVEELAAESGLTSAAVAGAREAVQVRESLNGRVGTDGAVELLDLVADLAAVDPAELAEEHERRAQVQAAVAALPARERDVIRRRFGFAQAPESLGEIASEIGLARERVRQIEQHALATLARRLPPELAA